MRIPLRFAPGTLRQALLNAGSKSYVYDQANRLTGIVADSLTSSAAYNGARLKHAEQQEPRLARQGGVLSFAQASVRPPAKRTRFLPFRAQAVLSKEIGQCLQPVRELLDAAPGQNDSQQSSG